MRIKAKIVPGYGAASGKGGDPRYPKGTLRMQMSHFQKLGLDLSPYFIGTINVDISPRTFELGSPKHFFAEVDWSPHIPSENFYFFDVTLFVHEKAYQGLIYMPDPQTKVEMEQSSTVLELILPPVEQVEYGSQVEIEVMEKQIVIKS